MYVSWKQGFEWMQARKLERQSLQKAEASSCNTLTERMDWEKCLPTVTEERKEACPSARAVPLRIPIVGLHLPRFEFKFILLDLRSPQARTQLKKISCKWIGRSKCKKGHTFHKISTNKALPDMNSQSKIPEHKTKSAMSKIHQAKQTGSDFYECRTIRESLLNINILKNRTL